MKKPLPPFKKYSKPSAFYLQTKSDFFSNNDELLAKSDRQAELYSKQPRRAVCKLCETPLSGRPDLNSHGVIYAFCTNCGHLNGLFEDTKNFVEELYMSEAGKEYSRNYIDDNFQARAEQIYLPKLDFLTANLPAHENLKILDIGCGGGYFVYSGLSKGLNISGIDVGEDLIAHGNKQIEHLLGKRPLKQAFELDFFEAISSSDADVISAIGVLEHLRTPLEFLRAFEKSNARYLFFSVPMFSLSVLLENAFNDVFPRQLSGGHTHLFSETSIQWLYANHNLVPVAEWRFGTDVMDLYRSLKVSMKKNGATATVDALLGAAFPKIIDSLQGVLDQGHFCSEIHVLVSKK